MPSWSPSTPSSSIPLGSEDSHLLSQSLPSPDPFDASSHIHTGPGGADLSLSELSLSDKPYSRDGPRFSLLAPPPVPVRFSAEQSIIEECEEGGDTTGSVDEQDDANNTVIERVVTEKTREEKLQSDLFILKKLNASFAVLNDALQATKGATEQVAEQLSQTDALLDKYANMLAKSETVTRLIFDERWGGADTVTEPTPIRMRSYLSGSARRLLNKPDSSEKGKKRRIEKPRNAHAGKQKRQRSGRQRSVLNKRQWQLLRPRLLQGVEAQALSVVVFGVFGELEQLQPLWRPVERGDCQKLRLRLRLHLPFPAQGQLVQLAALVTVEVGPGQVLLQAGVQVCQGVFQREARRSLHPYDASGPILLKSDQLR
ncbi:hypothetical protein OG21DRAFT_660696 [Imleria badia]|nr:hypothetical protein OG21DRAFT_660696 [Imleria badia]